MIVSGGSAKLDALTSMRLVAALVVVVYHARGSLLPLSVMVPGAEAVSFFFVLSGFIPGLIQSLSQTLLSGLRVWAEVGGIAPFLCLKAPLPQPIST